jgi:hypothetical protein
MHRRHYSALAAELPLAGAAGAVPSVVEVWRPTRFYKRVITYYAGFAAAALVSVRTPVLRTVCHAVH